MRLCPWFPVSKIQSLDSSNAICIQLVVEYYVLLNLVMKFTPSWGLAGEGHVY